jgi:hypothetical protein
MSLMTAIETKITPQLSLFNVCNFCNKVAFSFFLGTCSCYFSTEYQGSYLTQSHIAHGGGVEYSRVDVLPTAIPVWGECHK